MFDDVFRDWNSKDSSDSLSDVNSDFTMNYGDGVDGISSGVDR
jgi:hypothetical protein